MLLIDNREEVSCVTVAVSGEARLRWARQVLPSNAESVRQASGTDHRNKVSSERRNRGSAGRERICRTDDKIGRGRILALLAPRRLSGSTVEPLVPSDMVLAVGCGAQAQSKGIWWMPWH